MDRRVRILRFWLLLGAVVLLSLRWPALWFALAPLGMAHIWTRTSDGSTGILIHPEGPPWMIAVGDAADTDCECCQQCDLLNDTFAADNIATDWDDRSGTWTVGSGTLNTTSASALIVTVAEQDAGATGAYVTATILCASTSDLGRLVAAYVDDSNYWFAEVQPGASNGTLKLFQRSGGVNTQRGSTRTLTGYNAGETATVCLGIGNGFVNAFATAGSGAGSVTFSSSPTIASTQAGCGTGAGSSDVKFDNFIHGISYVDDPDCYTCSPTGCGSLCTETSPIEVHVTMAGIANGTCSNCANYNATFVVPDLAAGETTPDCDGRFDFGLGNCGTTADMIEWVILSSGGNITIRITVTVNAGIGGSFSVVADYSFSGGPVEDCTAVDTETATVTTNSGTRCDVSAVTMTISTNP